MPRTPDPTRSPMTGQNGDSLRPPAYVVVPTETAWAGVDDGVARTMTRILGLCWTQGQRHTPPLTRKELVAALDRPRTTLSRHLAQLEALGWIRIERRGRRLVLHSLVRPSISPPAADAIDPDPAPPSRQASLLARPRPAVADALAAVGVENPMRDRLARDPALSPAWIWAWHLWTRHPHRANLNNPPGYVVRQLAAPTAPPDEYLALVTLTGEEHAALRAARYAGDGDLNDKLYRIYPLYQELYDEVQVVRASMA